MSKHQQAQGWLESADTHYQQAEELKECAPAESVSASQRCIELSIKSMFAILDIDFKKKHLINQENFRQLMNGIPEDSELEYLRHRLPRILLLGQLWAKFRNVAEYGFHTLKIPQSEVFTKTEAELAYKHAHDCYSAANRLVNHVLYS